VILASCSPFFRNILRKNPHSHPLLYMKGVTQLELKAILDFMYHGEVQVAQEDLNSFLAVAEELKVKGLTQNKSTADEKSVRGSFKPQSLPPPSSFPPPTPMQVTPAKRDKGPTFAQQLPGEALRMDGQSNAVKTEPGEDSGIHNSDSALLLYQDFDEDTNGDDHSHNYPDFRGHDSAHKQRLIEFVERVEEEGGVVAYKCGICHKTSARRDALTSHIENIHFPGAYKCYYCELVFNSQNTRNVHIGRKHKFNQNILQNSILGSTM